MHARQNHRHHRRAPPGIGEVAAIELAEQGARIVFIARDQARADDTLAKLRTGQPGAPIMRSISPISRGSPR